jgi:hypothetical protein
MAMTTATQRPRGDDGTNEVRNASRTTDVDVARENIARRAYELYEQRGCEAGHDIDDWLQAEQDLRQRRPVE